MGYPRWCVDALKSVGVELLEGQIGSISSGDGTANAADSDGKVKVVEGNGAKWE